MPRPKLDDPAIDAFLARHPAWRREGDLLIREHRAASAREALRKMQRIGDLAEGANHHPELTWVYDRLTLRLQTHDSGGVTSLDLHLAACIDDVLAEPPR